MIALALGPGQEIRLFFSRRGTIERGEVMHRISSRRFCMVSVPLRDAWGDGPTGYSLDDFSCDRCGRTMKIRRSSLVEIKKPSASFALKKRGLRIIR